MKKLLIFFMAVATMVLSNCTSQPTDKSNKPVAKIMTPGEEVYVKHCKLCHGSSGDLGLSGAANLKISVLNNAEIMTVVSDGRKAMPGWKAQLTPTQINDVAAYVITLRN
ncbi:MAG: cytochrome c [Chitinophagales bacterium]|jgi:mono/diheme cytochrome c family protein|nr:cytochrome c [Bacteroidota bacterium]MBK9556409.1 cytochrome c [Bacteroidota bacterium]MBL0280748.1 cytochrome c [Bacteroidota bacterium]MBP8249360.1 cytochrome c [Chitinophagales bacterium]MBP9880690.1 cytochrome c [Chitinophagales bacterium]